MPSILSRLRTRAVNQTSHHSSRSALPAPTTVTTATTPPTHVRRLDGERPINASSIQDTALATRKIYPDLDLLPDELNAGPKTTPHGLSPPVRRGLPNSSNLPKPTTSEPAQPNASFTTSAKDGGGGSDSLRASGSSGSSGSATPSGHGFIERLGNWSTFGRRRAPPPSLNEFGEQISPSPSAWRSRWTNSRLSSRPSSKTTSTHSSPHENNNNKESTSRLSYQSSSSRRTPVAGTTGRSNSYKRISTPVARELGFDSPRTLGHPSPEVNVASTPLPIPPMPPLDHPALRPRGKTATYPPRALSRGIINNHHDVEVTPPGQFTFGKVLRPYRSLPRVQNIFRPRMYDKDKDKDKNKNNKRDGEESQSHNRNREERERDEDAQSDDAELTVPTMTSWTPINHHSHSHPHSQDEVVVVALPQAQSQSLSTTFIPSLPSSSSTFTSPSSSSSPFHPKSTQVSAPVGSVDYNLYDPKVSLLGNVIPIPMHQQDAPRVRDQKPLRSSLKASTRPPHNSIASSSSSNAGALALMPSFSLVAAVATTSNRSPPQTPVSSPGRSEIVKGKRKADDVDTTPPDSKKATFAVPLPLPASQREHASSLAPSSYHNKRARLSGPSPPPPPLNASNTGTYPSRASSRLALTRAPSSTRSAPAHTTTGIGTGSPENASERERRLSLSQRSIPISALVTPHAPSIGLTSPAYHMRDPRRPPRHMETGWALRFRTKEEEGSPVQAWFFYVALVLFPLWWIGAVWRVPKTRVVGGTDTEKAVPLDDPQIEFDARSWRFRCRVMAVVSLFTYIPFIVCIAIFAGR